jgi:hypothetical protein
MSVGYQSTQLIAKMKEAIKLLNIHLNHFPNHERFGITKEIRSTAYRVYGGIVACQKGYDILGSLKKLDVLHEQLRMFIDLSRELGYYHFKDGKRDHSDKEALRRYTALSCLINDVGAMIGAWLTRLYKEKNGGKRVGA